MAKMKVKSIRVEQVTRFFREGSMMLGTVRSGSLGIESTVQIESDEPEDKIRKMMLAGEQSCFTLGSLTGVVPTQTHLTLNGKPLEFRE
jgi:hypothetical protein